MAVISFANAALWLVLGLVVLTVSDNGWLALVIAVAFVLVGAVSWALARLRDGGGRANDLPSAQ
ncbi:MAG TPA: hypothetical protein VHT75_02405 [Acidimicrobiales bacterium]|nr:hypothetical protein [Acidimicrobiales bacterium]